MNSGTPLYHADNRDRINWGTAKTRNVRVLYSFNVKWPLYVDMSIIKKITYVKLYGLLIVTENTKKNFLNKCESAEKN